MAFDLSSALSLIGGSPIQKVSSAIFENLKLAKTLDGGSITGLLNQVLGGGISSILQNPLASISSTLASTLASSASSLTSALGGEAATLVSAMTGSGGLSSITSSLSSMASDLSGLTSVGSFGLQDLINHDNLTSGFFGTDVPSALSTAVAGAPLTSGSLLTSINSEIGTITSAVIAGTQTVASGTAAIQAYSAQLTSIMTNSTSAFSTLQTSLPAMSAVASLGGAIGSSSPTFQAIVPMIVQTAPLATLTDALMVQISPSS